MNYLSQKSPQKISVLSWDFLSHLKNSWALGALSSWYTPNDCFIVWQLRRSMGRFRRHKGLESKASFWYLIGQLPKNCLPIKATLLESWLESKARKISLTIKSSQLMSKWQLIMFFHSTKSWTLLLNDLFIFCTTSFNAFCKKVACKFGK